MSDGDNKITLPATGQQTIGQIPPPTQQQTAPAQIPALLSQPQPAEVSAFGGAHNRLPPFHKANPKLWFAHVEAVFYTSKVTTQVMKYQSVIANLGLDVIEQVADLIEDQTSLTPYDTLKDRLIEVYGESENRRIQRLLQDTQLGNQRPSQLLRTMVQQAGTTMTKKTVAMLWLQKLPSRMQAILAATGQEDPDKLAATADKVAEIDQPPEVHAASASPSASRYSSDPAIDNLLKEFRQLKAEVAELRRERRGRSRDRNSSRNRRPRSASKSAGGLCFYHERFKERAQKCTQPCTWKPPLNEK